MLQSRMSLTKKKEKKRIREEEKKTCPTPSEDFLFHEMRTYCESYRVSPALCLPNLLLFLRLPGAVKAFKREQQAGRRKSAETGY